MALSLQTNAQVNWDKWILHPEYIYVVDSEGDTMHCSELLIDSLGEVTTAFPRPFRTDRDYYLYVSWTDTAGIFYPAEDSLGLVIPAVSKMEDMEIYYEK